MGAATVTAAAVTVGAITVCSAALRDCRRLLEAVAVTVAVAVADVLLPGLADETEEAAEAEDAEEAGGTAAAPVEPPPAARSDAGSAASCSRSSNFMKALSAAQHRCG